MVRLPTRSAVISFAAKSPDPSLMTRLFAALEDALATLIVVLPETPSALVAVIPDDAVTWRVLGHKFQFLCEQHIRTFCAASAVMSESTNVVVGAELPSTDTEPDTTPSIVNVLAVFHAHQ